MASVDPRAADRGGRSEADALVRGTLSFAGGPPAEASALVLRVLDVARMDVPAILVAEQVTSRPELFDGMSFEVAVPAGALVRSDDLIVRAHVDVSGSGEVDAGDYLTVESCPVVRDGVTVVRLQRV